MKVKSNTHGLKKLIADLRKMNGGKIEWGFFEEDTYANPRGAESVAEVAMLVENGHDNGGLFEGTSTPPRPFFEMAVTDSENIRQIRAAIKKYQRYVLQGKMSPEQKMEALADIVVAQLRESIINYTGPNNYITDATKEMRDSRGSSSSDPLVESGTLVDGVKAKVNGREV
jgi:hypothetical protein